MALQSAFMGHWWQLIGWTKGHWIGHQPRSGVGWDRNVWPFWLVCFVAVRKNLEIEQNLGHLYVTWRKSGLGSGGSVAPSSKTFSSLFQKVRRDLFVDFALVDDDFDFPIISKPRLPRFSDLARGLTPFPIPEPSFLSRLRPATRYHLSSMFQTHIISHKM